MYYLTDTNILISLSEPTRTDHNDVRICVRTLSAQKDVLCYTSQLLAEFWNTSRDRQPPGADWGFLYPKPSEG